MNLRFSHIWSIALIAAGAYWLIKKKVGVGIEGRKPSFFVQGLWATIIGLIAIAVGVYLLLHPVE
jgi:hypothetical protein